MIEQQATATAASIRPQTIVISDKKELYKAYMPFILGGAIFIQFNEEITPNKIQPGQKIFIVFSMLDNKQKIPIQGKVVWVNKSGLAKGYGVALGDSAPMRALKENIENNITELMAKKEQTYTF
jgi:type IV pilus assembly protein PilZ